ncbi:MAG: hypothetical protein NC350_03055, partial [Corallococcus sp.]|nr:hypothetical protein [Corallococcus sp.]
GEIEQEDKYFFWQEKQVFNHIAPIVETRSARLNRVRPRPTVRPFSPSDCDVNAAKMSTRILQGASDKLMLDEILSQATMWSEVCGTSFYKVTWQTSAVEKDGVQLDASDVKVTVCPPFEIYPDGNSNQSIADCNSVIHARAYSVAEVKRIWGKDVKGDKIPVFALTCAIGGVGGLGYNSTVPAVTRETKNDCCLVIERYTRPDDRYPDGRLEIIANDVLLYTGDLPYCNGVSGERDFPFVKQTCYEQAGCFWGASVIERVIPVQRAYNAVKNRKHEFLNRLSMGILTVEDGSVDLDDLEDEGLSPGKILVYRQGSEKPSIMDGGNIPSEFDSEEEKLLDEFVSVSGVSEFARSSSAPTRVTSGTALQLIAEQDEIRMASSIDSIKQSVRKIAKMILRLYRQFAGQRRLMRLTDGQGKAEVFYFTAADISEGDIVFDAESQLTDSLAARKSMLFDLLSAGLLYDKDGKLSTGVKSKILTMLGFGNWESAQDIAQMHETRAENENFDINNAEFLEIDDHELHIDKHVRFIISGQADKQGAGVKEKLLQHIALHQKYVKEKSNGQIQ